MKTESQKKQKGKLVPKLRFKGFDGEWKLSKFGQVVNNKSAKHNPEKEKNSFKCIELEHLSSNFGTLLGYIDSVNSASIKNKFEKGDVLFGKLRPYLRKYLQAPFDGVCSSEIWVLKGEGVSSNFLYQVVQTDAFIDLANQSTGSKMPRADWKVVSSEDFLFPTLPEQQKISSFLSSVDEKLSQLTRKKELLAQYKKGVMQQLFSGKLRFKDENGKEFKKWEEKRLGEVGEIVTGKTPSTADLNLWDGPIQFVTPTDINENKYQTETQRTIKELPKTKLLPPKSIMFTCIASIGKMSLSLNPCVTNQQINSIVPSKEFDCEFVYYSVLNIAEYIKSTQSNTTLPIINKTQFSKFIIGVPSIKEQQKIATFLSSIDDKITAISAQISQTQSFKKGLLQQMFV